MYTTYHHVVYLLLSCTCSYKGMKEISLNHLSLRAGTTIDDPTKWMMSFFCHVEGKVMRSYKKVMINDDSLEVRIIRTTCDVCCHARTSLLLFNMTRRIQIFPFIRPSGNKRLLKSRSKLSKDSFAHLPLVLVHDNNDD